MIESQPDAAVFDAAFDLCKIAGLIGIVGRWFEGVGVKKLFEIDLNARLSLSFIWI